MLNGQQFLNSCGEELTSVIDCTFEDFDEVGNLPVSHFLVLKHFGNELGNLEGNLFCIGIGIKLSISHVEEVYDVHDFYIMNHLPLPFSLEGSRLVKLVRPCPKNRWMVSA